MSREFESYDYLNITVSAAYCSQYIDGYESLGWQQDENVPQEHSGDKITLHMKRSRSIMNKTELTRLQRHYEACVREIIVLEESRQSIPTMVAIGMGMLGCAFLAGSVFAIIGEPPVYWLMVLLGIPGLALWGAALPVYRMVRHWRSAKVTPLIETKYDEAYEVCARAQSLLR